MLSPAASSNASQFPDLGSRSRSIPVEARFLTEGVTPGFAFPSTSTVGAPSALAAIVQVQASAPRQVKR